MPDIDPSPQPSLFETDRRYKYLDPFICVFVVVLLISNIIASKFFAIGLFRVSSAQLLFPITYIFRGHLHRGVWLWGVEAMQSGTVSFASFIMVAASTIAVAIPPAPEYANQAAICRRV